ncbi:MAG TPA: PspC domain-containing protein [Nocardioides sp.]|nr:PspC domain-containing protein [Nocardioides sp.]
MTTPPNSSTTEEPQTAGPRVSGEQMRDLTRLRRSTSDRKIAGVAGGIARHLDIDPLVVRIALVVMVFFGGGGLLFYLACWLLVPEDTSPRATIPLDDRSRNVALWIVAGCSALAAIGNSVGQWHFPWPLAVIALVVLGVVSHSGHRRWSPPPPVADVPVEVPVAAREAGTTPPPPPPPAYAGYIPPIRRDPRRRGPILFGFTLALAALGIGLLITLELAGADVPHSAYPAMVAGSCGLMLVVSAWYGRGGGLIPVGLLALLALLASSVIGDWHGGRIVDRPTTATSVDSSYRLGVGELRLDLSDVSDLRGLDGRTIDVQGRVGHLVVIVPDTGLDVTANATIDGGGETVLFGTQNDGTSSATHDGGPTAPQLTIDADLVFGQIEIRTEETR